MIDACPSLGRDQMPIEVRISVLKFHLEQEAQEEESYKHKKKQHLVTKILEDYYELLDLDELRWRATQDDIKKACECIFREYNYIITKVF